MVTIKKEFLIMFIWIALQQ